MNKETELNWLHCQRTHYYPAQPVPQMPRQLEYFHWDWSRPGFHEGENNNHFSVDVWSSVSMILLITKSDLSKPFKPFWMVVFNVIPQVLQDPKNTTTIFQLVWRRALVGTKAAPVCLAQNLFRFLDLFQVMIILRSSKIVGYFHKFTESITTRLIHQLLSDGFLLRRWRQERSVVWFLTSESLRISSDHKYVTIWTLWGFYY